MILAEDIFRNLSDVPTYIAFSKNEKKYSEITDYKLVIKIKNYNS